MLGLPYGNRRWLIEYVSNRTHIRKILIKLFLKLLEMMRSSKKTILETLLRVTLNNAQSTTGSNLRSIAMELNKWPVNNIVPCDTKNLEYFPIKDDDQWVLEALEQILEPKEDIIAIGGDAADFLERLYAG